MEDQTIPTAEEIREQINEELQQNEAYQDWFGQFRESTWKSFITDYADFKQHTLNYAGVILESVKPKVTEFNVYAQEILLQIQLKKLYNLYCEWRANRIKLPGIQISYDFEIIAATALETPLLPPVTRQEVDLYLEFLRSPDAEIYDEDYYYEWQQGLFSKPRFQTGYYEPPGWFQFYDEKCGTDILAQLPNHRGELEEYYTMAPVKKKPEPPVPPSAEEQALLQERSKPLLSTSNQDHLSAFIRRFEDEKTAEVLLACVRKSRLSYDFEDLDEDYEYLKTIPHPIAFVPDSDWKESLRLTVINYKMDGYIRALPRIWRQYRKKTGDALEANREQLLKDFQINYDEFDPYKVRKMIVGQILEGRAFLGEPENLDF